MIFSWYHVKDAQETMETKIAIQGIRGSYHHEVASNFLARIR